MHIGTDVSDKDLIRAGNIQYHRWSSRMVIWPRVPQITGEDPQSPLYSSQALSTCDKSAIQFMFRDAASSSNGQWIALPVLQGNRTGGGGF